MPREIKKRLKGRTQVNPQQTFDFTVPQRRGAARTVDVYERQFMNPQTKGILTFLDSFNRTAKTAMQANEIYKAKKLKEGAVAAQRGEDKPELGIAGTGIGGEHWAFLQGYENFKGEAAVSQYHKEINKLLSESGNLDPDEWNAKKEALTQSMINGRSDAFLAGFVPKALQLEEKYDVKYHQILRERIKNDYLAGVGTIAESDITRTFSDETLSPEERDKVIRDALTAQQNRSKSLKMADRNSVSAQYINKAIYMAKSQGRPEFLRWLSQADKDGVVLANHPDFQEAISSAKISAQNIKESNEREAETERRRRLKEFGDTLQKKIQKGIEDGNMVEAREAILAAEPFLPPAAFESMLKEANKGVDESSFGKFTDADIYMKMYDLATEGKLTSAHFTKYRMKVTKGDYMSLGEVNSRAQESKKKSGNTKPQYMKDADEYKALLKTLVTGNKLVEMYKLPEKQAIAKATHLWNMAIQSELKANGSKNLTFEWFNKTMNTIAKSILNSENKDTETKPTGGYIGSGNKEVLTKYK